MCKKTSVRKESEYKSLNTLYEGILNGCNSDKFIGITAEAGSGKSYITCLGMIEAYKRNTEIDLSNISDELEIQDFLDKKNDTRRSIYCCFERKEAKAIVREINGLAKENMAKVFINLTDKEIEDIKDNGEEDMYILNPKDLNNTPILVTTHARYLLACEYKDTGIGSNETINFVNSFEGYDNLIIDEGLDPVEKTLFSIELNKIHELMNAVKSYNNGYYLEIFNNYLFPLVTYLLEANIEPNSHIRGDKLNTDTKLQEFYELKGIIINTILNKIKSDGETFDNFEAYNIEEIVNGIYLIYRNLLDINYKKKKNLATVIISTDNLGRRTISTYNHRLQFIKLKNNFILNASAGFLSYYDSKLFKRTKTERLTDHSNVRVVINKTNTSTTAYHQDTFDEKNNKILEDILNNFNTKAIALVDEELIKFQKQFPNSFEMESIQDKSNTTLLYHRKNYADKFKELKLDDEEEDTLDFQCLNKATCKGTNDYADYKVMVICHTTRMPLPYYIFLRDYYWGKICENINYSMNNINGITFEDEIINNLYKEVTADFWYQFIKRGQRGYLRKPERGTVYAFYTNSMDIVKIVLEQLGGLDKNKVLINDNSKSTFYKVVEYLNGKWTGLRKLKDIQNELQIKKDALYVNLNLAKHFGIFEDLSLSYATIDKETYIWKKDLDYSYDSMEIYELDGYASKLEEVPNRKSESINLTKLCKFLLEKVDKQSITDKNGGIKEFEKLMKSTFNDYKNGKIKTSLKNMNKTINSLGMNIDIIPVKNHKNDRIWSILKKIA